MVLVIMEGPNTQREVARGNREHKPDCRRTDRELEEDEEVRSRKPSTQDTGYGGSVSSTPLVQATEETTKDPLEKSDVVCVKEMPLVIPKSRQTPISLQDPCVLPRETTVESQNVPSELVSASPLLQLPSEDSEPDPPCPFTIDEVTSAHGSCSKESLEVREEETHPSSQTLVLPNHSSIMSHVPSNTLLLMLFVNPVEETGASNSAYKPFAGFSEYDKDGCYLIEDWYSQAIYSTSSSSQASSSEQLSVDDHQSD